MNFAVQRIVRCSVTRVPPPPMKFLPSLYSFTQFQAGPPSFPGFWRILLSCSKFTLLLLSDDHITPFFYAPSCLYPPQTQVDYGLTLWPAPPFDVIFNSQTYLPAFALSLHLLPNLHTRLRLMTGSYPHLKGFILFPPAIAVSTPRAAAKPIDVSALCVCFSHSPAQVDPTMPPKLPRERESINTPSSEDQVPPFPAPSFSASLAYNQ